MIPILAAGYSCSGDKGAPQVEDRLTPIFFDFDTGVLSSVPGPIESDPTTYAPTEDVDGIQVLRIDGATVDYRNAALVGEASIKAGSNTMAISPLQYYSATHDNANFLVFHPKGDGDGKPDASGIVKFTITGQQDIMSSPVGDVLHPAVQTAVYGVNDKNNPINFRLEHKLALVELEVVAVNATSAAVFGAVTGSGLMGVNKLELHIASSGDTQLVKDGSATAVRLDFSDHAMVVQGSGQTSVGQVMVFPQDTPLSSINIAFVNAPAKDYTVTGIDKLEAGKRYRITANVTAYSILFNVTVEAWQTGFSKDISIGTGT